LPLEGIDNAKFDVYSASSLVDTFIAAEPQFVLGERHDACEALQCMLGKMQDFRALFAVDNTQALAEVIYLRGFDDASDVWSLEKFLQEDVSKVVTMCVARNSRLHSTARIDLLFNMFSDLFICSFLHVSNGSFAYDFRCFIYLGQRRAPHYSIGEH